MTDTVIEELARYIEPWAWSLDPPDMSSGQARQASLVRAEHLLGVFTRLGYRRIPDDCVAIGAKLEWRTDDFGHERHAIFLGNIFVGRIDNWDKPNWRGWTRATEDGVQTGEFSNADAARTSVEYAVRFALTTPPPKGGTP